MNKKNKNKILNWIHLKDIFRFKIFCILYNKKFDLLKLCMIAAVVWPRRAVPGERVVLQPPQAGLLHPPLPHHRPSHQVGWSNSAGFNIHSFSLSTYFDVPSIAPRILNSRPLFFPFLSLWIYEWNNSDGSTSFVLEPGRGGCWWEKQWAIA